MKILERDYSQQVHMEEEEAEVNLDDFLQSYYFTLSAEERNELFHQVGKYFEKSAEAKSTCVKGPVNVQKEFEKLMNRIYKEA